MSTAMTKAMTVMRTIMARRSQRRSSDTTLECPMTRPGVVDRKQADTIVGTDHRTFVEAGDTLALGDRRIGVEARRFPPTRPHPFKFG